MEVFGPSGRDLCAVLPEPWSLGWSLGTLSGTPSNFSGIFKSRDSWSEMKWTSETTQPALRFYRRNQSSKHLKVHHFFIWQVCVQCQSLCWGVGTEEETKQAYSWPHRAYSLALGMGRWPQFGVRGHLENLMNSLLKKIKLNHCTCTCLLSCVWLRPHGL